MAMNSNFEAKDFYDREYRKDRYASARGLSKHPFHAFLSRVLDEFGLADKKCLEVGCGRGALQDVVDDYTGVDLSDSVQPFLLKPFHACSASSLPFADNAFDVVWTYAVLEHVPDLEQALREMRRVLRPDGFLLLHAAWHCPFYAAQGYPVRAYREFDLPGKVLKFVAGFHRTLPCRAASIMFLRMGILLRELFGRADRSLHYSKLKPNYETFWMSDSDAVNSMDQMETVFWFLRQGDECLLPATGFRRFFQMNGEILIRVRKDVVSVGDTERFGARVVV